MQYRKRANDHREEARYRINYPNSSAARREGGRARSPERGGGQARGTRLLAASDVLHRAEDRGRAEKRRPLVHEGVAL